MGLGCVDEVCGVRDARDARDAPRAASRAAAVSRVAPWDSAHGGSTNTRLIY